MALPPFQYQHRVTYAECTAGNHIYYSRYLNILEAARGEFFRTLGSPLLAWQQQEIIFPVIECRLRYKAPARYDDLLAIELWPTVVEGIRLNFEYQIHNADGKLILQAETQHICTGINEKPRRLPEPLISALQPYIDQSGTG